MTRRFPILLLALGVLVLHGCGDDDDASVDPVDSTAPTVTGVSPADGAVDVLLLRDFTFTFSEDMAADSFDAATVSAGGHGGALHLQYDAGARQLRVLPDSMWTPEATIQITVDGATDDAGNAVEPFSTGFSTVALDCAGLADRLESNGDIGSAVPAELDAAFPVLSICDDDRDYFSFTLTERARVSARMHYIYSEEEYWNIYFARADEQQYSSLGTTARAGNTSVHGYTFEPGTYYVATFVSSPDDFVLYDLSLETGTPCTDDIYEDNDFEDEAAPITVGLHTDLRGCYVDKDWYSLDVLAGQTITVTITEQSGATSLTRRLIIDEPGGARAAESAYTNPLTLSLEATAAGQALIQTRFWRDEIDYDLEIEVISE